jgi:Holliday junction DNA helicase RuvA
MIAFLTGEPKVIDDKLIVLTNGVGYGVTTGAETFLAAQTQPTVSLYIYTHVKEDVLELFGFTDYHDYLIFQKLLKVSGVGPKTAVSIVDGRAAAVVTAVQQADTQFFSATPRVGKKLAQKIIIELRTSLGEIDQLDLSPQTPQQQAICEALLSLGFAEPEINKAVKKLELEELPLEQAITLTIKAISHVN